MKKLISLILIPAIVLTGCSGLNTKEDYINTTSHLASDDIEKAAKSLPRGEGKTFITIMENTYLNLLAGKPEIDTLALYSRSIENQVRYKVSRGVKSFFFI
jgi:PBP1b-binding outer membrane lipoprotein LpoB